jgi:hypothetical protein
MGWTCWSTTDCMYGIITIISPLIINVCLSKNKIQTKYKRHLHTSLEWSKVTLLLSSGWELMKQETLGKCSPETLGRDPVWSLVRTDCRYIMGTIWRRDQNTDTLYKGGLYSVSPLSVGLCLSGSESSQLFCISWFMFLLKLFHSHISLFYFIQPENTTCGLCGPNAGLSHTPGAQL